MRVAFAILMTLLLALAPASKAVSAPDAESCDMIACAACKCCVQQAPLGGPGPTPAATQHRQASIDHGVVSPVAKALAWQLEPAAEAAALNFRSALRTEVPLFKRHCSYLL